jgi:hypothetical protein
MAAAGGPARVLCPETGLGTGGTWSSQGVILFGSERGPLRRVDAAGGPCTVVGKDDPANFPRSPVFLPDGNHFLYLPSPTQDGGVYVAALDDPEPRRVLADRSGVVYAPPVGGGPAHLLFLRENALMAQPFDQIRLEPVGDPFLVAPSASRAATQSQVAASVSNGTLVYVAERSNQSQLTWFDRSGQELGKAGASAQQTGIGLSADGNLVLTNRPNATGGPTLWLVDLLRGSESRFLPAGAAGRASAWLPDGRRVVFQQISTQPGLFQSEVNAVAQPERLSPDADTTIRIPSSFSRDGRFLVYTALDPRTGADIWYVPWSAKPDWQDASKFMATEAAESQGQVSPDGKWLAFTSDATGRYEVYVRSFPDGARMWRVSVDGGVEPRWNVDGTELYYLRTLTGERATLMAASLSRDARGSLQTERPHELFDIRGRAILPQENVFRYSPHPDGRRFLVNAFTETGDPTINVITNWQKTLSSPKLP